MARRKVLAGRNPLLLLRFPGSLLLRLAERAFSALLLNAPPRKTRLFGRCPAKRMFEQQKLSQFVRIGLAGMANPAHDAAQDFFRPDGVFNVLALQEAQPAAKGPDVFFCEQPMRGEAAIAQKRNALAHGKDDVLRWMKPQPQAGQQVRRHLPQPVQVFLVVGEHEEIIAVAHEAAGPQVVLEEVVE